MRKKSHGKYWFGKEDRPRRRGALVEKNFAKVACFFGGGASSPTSRQSMNNLIINKLKSCEWKVEDEDRDEGVELQQSVWPP